MRKYELGDRKSLPTLFDSELLRVSFMLSVGHYWWAWSERRPLGTDDGLNERDETLRRRLIATHGADLNVPHDDRCSVKLVIFLLFMKI